MMTFNELQEKLVGETLYWNDAYGDRKDVIDHIIASGTPAWSYEICFKCGDGFHLSRQYMEALVATGQTTIPPANINQTPTTFRWRETRDVETVTSDNANNAYIDWEQRTWDAATTLYCQMPSDNRSAVRAVQEAQALMAAYRKLMRE